MIRRLIVRLLKGIALSILVVSALVILAYAALRIAPVNEYLLNLVKLEFEKGTGWKLSAQQMDRVSPFSLRLRKVELSRPGQATIRAERISLSLSPQYLLIGRLFVPTISIRDVVIEVDHRPSPAPTAAASLGSLNLPLSLTINSLLITNAQLPPEWEIPALTLAGHVHASLLHETALLEAKIYKPGQEEDPTFLLLSLHTQADDLMAQIRIAEDINGVLHQATQVLTGYSIELHADSRLASFLPLAEIEDSVGAFSLLATASGESDSSPFSPGILGDQALFEAHYHWQAATGFHLSNILLSRQQGQALLEAHGKLFIDSLRSPQKTRLELATSDLTGAASLCPVPIKGGVHLSLALDGSWDTPRVSVDLRSPNLQIRTARLDDLRLQSEGFCSSDAISGTAALCCQVGAVSTTSTFRFDWDQGPELAIQDLHVQTPTSTLRGDLRLILSNLLLTGRMEGELGSIRWVLPSSLQELEGTGEFQLDLMTNPGQSQQNMKLAVQLEGISGPHLSSGRLAGTLDLDNLFDSALGKATISIADLRFYSSQFTEMSFESIIPPRGQPWRYDLSAAGRFNGNLRIKSSGTIQPFTDISELTIHSFGGTLDTLALQLKEAVTLQYEGETLAVTPFQFKVGQGMITGGGTYGPYSRLKLGISSMPIEILHRFWSKLPDQGMIAGEASLSGSLDDPELAIDLIVDRAVILGGLFKLPPLNANISGKIGNGQFHLNGSLMGIGERPVTWNAMLPVHFSLNPQMLVITPNEPLSAQLYASGDITSFLDLLPSDKTSLSGNAEMALSLSGTYQEPLISGSLNLQNGTYESFGTGSIFTDINAQFAGQGKELALKKMSAHDHQGGQVTATGAINLDPTKNYPFSFTFNCQQALLLNRDYTEGIATGSLRLHGDMEKTELTGHLVADRMSMTIPKERRVTPPAVDIAFVNTPETQSKPQSSSGRSVTPMAFDVTLDVPGRAFAVSEDFWSEWRGALAITGNSNAPLYNGELRVIRGDYRLNGKTFELDKGTVTFAGDLEKKTSLYVVFRQDIDRYTIEAVLKGPVRSPELMLRSNPHMSQREILSWIIFNRGLNDITPFENDIAGQAVVDISNPSKRSDTDVMASLRRFGIDRFDFSTNGGDPDSKDVSVNIGKYLSRDVFISLNQGLTNECSKVCLEANLIRHVKLQAEVDDEATGGIRLIWKHDY